MNLRPVILALPILMGGGLVLSGLAWLLTVQLTEGEARGGQIRVRLSSDCANAAILGRLGEWGLPGRIEGDTVIFTGPGMPDDASHMPAALLAPGHLELRGAGGEPIEAQLRHAGVQISVEGTPVTLMTLDRALPADASAWIDGVRADVESINGGELQLRATAEESRAAVRLATDRTVWLRWPLPCDVKAR